MSGLKPRRKPGRCRVQGHGNDHIKGVCRDAGCTVYAEIPAIDRAYEKRQVQREIALELETSPPVGAS